MLQEAKIAADAPLNSLSDSQRHRLWHGADRGTGVLHELEQEFATCTREKRLEELSVYRGSTTCGVCRGARLRPEALAVRLGQKNMQEIVSLPVQRALTFFEQLTFAEPQRPISDPLVAEILRRLQFLQHVGLEYLTLDRPVDTLSGGERQRVRLATCIGSGLVGVCYILDEPSIGLHPRDNQRLIESLRNLQRQGNTVIVVEHDEDAMRAADHLIDMGPGAGRQGGAIVAEGAPQEIIDNPRSITGRYLSGASQVRWNHPRRSPQGKRLILRGAAANNLRKVDLELPLGLLVCVTGVSGSGKSSLIMETLAPAVSRSLGQGGAKPGAHSSLRGVEHLDKLIQIDQSPIGRSPRSNPATYIGAFDEIRKVFASTRDAKQRGYRASRFSFNVKGGRCEACQGQGVKRIEMNFLPDMFVPCEDCRGSRFNRATLQARFKGRSIADVLDMMIEEAAAFFENISNLHRSLQCLVDVGLGYLKLGQPSTTLSGGEAQRVKLAAQLARTDTGSTLYILDEPTTGLHFEDIQRLLNVLQRLVNKGNTVLVIEHQMDIVRAADWIVDLGPEGGEQGGSILVAGPPEAVAACPESHTGRRI